MELSNLSTRVQGNKNLLSKSLLLYGNVVALYVVLGPEIFLALSLDHISFSLPMPRL